MPCSTANKRDHRAVSRDQRGQQLKLGRSAQSLGYDKHQHAVGGVEQQVSVGRVDGRLWFPPPTAPAPARKRQPWDGRARGRRRLSSRLIHWRNAQTASSNMAHASKAKMDQGSTAPKASGPSKSTAQASQQQRVLVSARLRTFATGGRGFRSGLPGLSSRFVLGILGFCIVGRIIGRISGKFREKARNRRAKACREWASPQGNARWPAPGAWWSLG